MANLTYVAAVARALWRWRWILALMALSAVIAVVVAEQVFPDGSPNHDESAYLSQAEALREGRLTLASSAHDPSFLPFLSAVDGDNVVFKYQPTWPAFLAGIRTVTGSYVPALALSAAAVTGVVAWFAWELTRRRRIALGATALFALTPFVIIESGTYLAYLPTVALLGAAGAALLRARRDSATWWFVASGALFGLAAFHRLYDTFLFGLPFVPWFIVTSRSEEQDWVRRLGQLAAGAAPLLFLMLAYNWRVTGSPVRMPFSVGAPLDRFGFGRRASFGDGAAGIDYDVGTALSALGEFAGSLERWLLGGIVAVALAALAVIVQRRAPGVLLAAGIVAVFPLGYFFWWGTGNAVRFELEDVVGPFYWLPALPAFCVLVVLGGAWLWGRQRVVVAAAAAGAVLVSAVALPDVARRVDEATATEADIASLERSVPHHSLLLRPPLFGPDRYSHAVVRPGPSGDRLVAFLPDEPGARFELFDRFPDRGLYETIRHRPWDDFFAPHELAVRPAAVVDTDVWDVIVDVANPIDAPAAIAYLRIGDERIEVPLDELGEPFERVTFQVTPGARTARAGESSMTIEAGTAVRVAAGIALGDGATMDELEWFELRWDVLAVDGSLRVQDPPAEWQRVVFPGVVFGEAVVEEFVRQVG